MLTKFNWEMRLWEARVLKDRIPLARPLADNITFVNISLSLLLDLSPIHSASRSAAGISVPRFHLYKTLSVPYHIMFHNGAQRAPF